MANRAAGLNALFKMATGAENAAPAVKPAAKKAALTEMGGADDWGWKGGKPGEISGTEFERQLRANRDAMGRILPNKQRADEVLRRKAYDQTATMPRGDVRSLMGDFADLEAADVPREWTGKIMKSVGRPLWEMADDMGSQLFGTTTAKGNPLVVMSGTVARGISDAMRPMTNSQRETFVTLLPEWSGTIEELAAAARTL